MRSIPAVVALLALIPLTACGASDDHTATAPLSPASTAPPSPSGTPAAQQQADVEAALRAYEKAMGEVNAHPQVTPDVLAHATSQWADTVVGNYRKNLFSTGKWIIGGGEKIVSVHSDINGTTATLHACTDDSNLFIVKQGVKAVGVGSTPIGGRSMGTFTLTLDDGVWKVSDAKGSTKTC